jgi:MFS family permease
VTAAATPALSGARRWIPLGGLNLSFGISQLGTGMSALAIPWLVLVTTGSAARTGLTGFAEMAPYVVIQAIAGPVVDRIGLRRSVIAGNAAAAVLVGVIPALYALDALSLGPLLALVALAGAVRGAADAAYAPLVPRAAASGGIPNERAAGINSVAQRTGMLVGTPLAGVLIAVAGSQTVVLIDAVTFAVAAGLITVTVPGSAASGGAAADPGTGGERLTIAGYLADLREGMRFIRGDRLIAGIVLMIAVTNLLDQSLSSVLVPVWVRDQLHQPTGLGFIGGAGSVGLVTGAVAGTWLGPRLPRYAAYSFGCLIGFSPVFFALAFSRSLPPVLAVEAVSGLAAGTLNPIIGAVSYERIPERLQARVLGAVRSSAWVGIPFGSLLGGALTQEIGLRGALLITGTVMLATTLTPFVFPSWRELGARRGPG